MRPALAARRSSTLFSQTPRRVHSCQRRSYARSVPVLTAQLVIESKCELGESPVWCTKTETLFFVDCLGHGVPKFWAYKPSQSELAVSNVDPNLCTAIGSIGLVEGGGLIMASDRGIQLLQNPHTSDDTPTPSWGAFERLAHPLAVEGLVDWTAPTTPNSIRLNDGRVDRQGRFVVGAYHPEHGTFIDKDGNVDPHMPRGRVYRVVISLRHFRVTVVCYWWSVLNRESSDCRRGRKGRSKCFVQLHRKAVVSQTELPSQKMVQKCFLLTARPSQFSVSNTLTKTLKQ
jgi:hypothetical protein